VQPAQVVSQGHQGPFRCGTSTATHFAAETYDPRRWDGKGADASFEPGMWLASLCIVVPDWNAADAAITVKLDGKPLTSGKDFRHGYESTATGKNLVVWLHKTLYLTTAEEHRAAESILPKSP
jgi:hypothetical protein